MIWRIRDRDVFRRLAAEGRRARAGVLWCTFLPDPSASPPRVAFAIGRAIGPAVVRNQARRRLRCLLVEASWPPGWYLIGARPAITERSFDALRRELAQLQSAVERGTPRSGSAGSGEGTAAALLQPALPADPTARPV